MRRQTFLLVLVTLLVVGVVVALLVRWAIGSHDAAVKTMTAQAPATIVSAKMAEDPNASTSDSEQYVVVFTYTATARPYTAQASFDGKDAFTAFAAKGVKTCYDPANPASSSLVGASFVCGTTAGEAVISDPMQTSK